MAGLLKISSKFMDIFVSGETKARREGEISEATGGWDIWTIRKNVGQEVETRRGFCRLLNFILIENRKV